MTLEKDMSYPKPPVLNVKWANRDINVIEWVNIPKFSMLDNLVTPLRLVKLFFFDILVEKMHLFLSMLLLTGYQKLPDHKMYWEGTPV